MFFFFLKKLCGDEISWVLKWFKDGYSFSLNVNSSLTGYTWDFIEIISSILSVCVEKAGASLIFFFFLVIKEYFWAFIFKYQRFKVGLIQCYHTMWFFSPACVVPSVCRFISSSTLEIFFVFNLSCILGKTVAHVNFLKIFQLLFFFQSFLICCNFSFLLISPSHLTCSFHFTHLHSTSHIFLFRLNFWINSTALWCILFCDLVISF